MTGFDALTPPSPRLLGPTPLNEKPALPASVAAAAVAPAAEMAPEDDSFATSPGKANFAPKGDVNFGDKSPDAAPVSAGDKKIPDFVKEIMKKKEQAASYRVGQDQSKDRLDQSVADPHLSLWPRLSLCSIRPPAGWSGSRLQTLKSWWSVFTCLKLNKCGLWG